MYTERKGRKHVKEYVRLGILHTSAKCDFPIAGIKCHNHGNKWKEVFIGLMISKRDSITIGGDTWQQAAGKGSQEITSNYRVKQKWGEAINTQSSLPMTYFVQQGHFPNSITSQGPNIQIPECLGDIAHPNYQACYPP